MYRSYDHVPNSHNLPAEVDFNQLHIYQKLKRMIVMITSGTLIENIPFNRICTSGGEERLQEVIPTPFLLYSPFSTILTVHTCTPGTGPKIGGFYLQVHRSD